MFDQVWLYIVLRLKTRRTHIFNTQKKIRHFPPEKTQSGEAVVISRNLSPDLVINIVLRRMINPHTQDSKRTTDPSLPSGNDYIVPTKESVVWSDYWPKESISSAFLWPVIEQENFRFQP